MLQDNPVAFQDTIEGSRTRVGLTAWERSGELAAPSAAVERLAGERGAVPDQDPSRRGLLVWVGDQAVPWRRTYADVAVGALVALDNAHGDLEIALRDGNAAERLGAGPGTRVRVVRAA